LLEAGLDKLTPSTLKAVLSAVFRRIVPLELCRDYFVNDGVVSPIL
jgi:hypothetical protein